MEEHAYENQVTMRLESADLTVAPGSSVNVPVTLHNLGTTDGFFETSVRGIPGTWSSPRCWSSARRVGARGTFIRSEPAREQAQQYNLPSKVWRGEVQDATITEKGSTA